MQKPASSGFYIKDAWLYLHNNVSNLKLIYVLTFVVIVPQLINEINDSCSGESDESPSDIESLDLQPTVIKQMCVKIDM